MVGGRVEILPPRVVDGMWEVELVCLVGGGWVEVGKLRFDGLGRLRPVTWPRIYEKVAAVMGVSAEIVKAAGGMGLRGEPTAQAMAEALPATCPITGLPRLQAWYMRVRRLLAAASRYGEVFCAAWARMQGIERLDGMFGPGLTDGIWGVVARRVKEAAGEEILIASAGRGELAMVMNGSGEQAAVKCLHVLQKASHRPVTLFDSGEQITIQICAGVAEAGAGCDAHALRQWTLKALRVAETEKALVKLWATGNSNSL